MAQRCCAVLACVKGEGCVRMDEPLKFDDGSSVADTAMTRSAAWRTTIRSPLLMACSFR
ncbi:hypothetical protein RE6C_02771 [Rhodopirellula europaea 6C]|uniref:Uncharacterized protein n=1 Tax=Rhodopirellula europaea 6C TaxID=1263867 RepID=M2A6I4_9BACT|nr:hypothetical protein RE6C_02771 [Rhodopirellula europaea 6C]